MEFFDDADIEIEDNGRQAVLFVVDYKKYSTDIILHRLKDLFYENLDHKVGCILFNHPLEEMPIVEGLNPLEKNAANDGIRLLLPIQIASYKTYPLLKDFRTSTKTIPHKSDFLKVLYLVSSQIKGHKENKNIVFITDEDYDMHSTKITTRLKDIEDFHSECQLIGESNLQERITKDCNVFKSKPKKSSGNTFLQIGSLHIGVKVYMLYKQFQKPKKIRLSSENTIIGSKKQGKVYSYTMTDLGKKESKLTIKFTPEEKNTLRNISETGIEALDFVEMPETILGLRESKFIYPTDEKYSNSSKVFTALLSSCLTLNKCILVRFRISKSMVPRHGLLIPRKERTDPILSPNGFYMIELAISDDLRSPSIPESVATSDVLIDSFTDLFNNTMIENYMDIRDPYLEAQRSKLEALILHEPSKATNQFAEYKAVVAKHIPTNLADMISEYSTTTKKRASPAVPSKKKIK